MKQGATPYKISTLQNINTFKYHNNTNLRGQ